MNRRRFSAKELRDAIREHQKIPCSGGLGKSMWLFFAANAAIILSLGIVVDILDPEYTFSTMGILLVYGFTVPFAMLLFSKNLAKWEYKIRIITPQSAKDEKERYLCELIASLAIQANLPNSPEVGIYSSSEINAFATGSSQSNSMIAFSNSLLEYMTPEEIAGVAGHETAHIANGDMLTMTLLEGLINSVVLIADLAIQQTEWYEKMREKAYFTSILIHFAIANGLMLAGNMVLLWFSRHREFEADETSARLVYPEAMTKALKKLGHPIRVIEKKETNTSAAAMMISTPPACLDIFSTHPSLERRIGRLGNVFKK